MERRGFKVPASDRAHKHLIDRLSNTGHVGIRQAGSDMDDLRDDRNDADYDLWRRPSRKDADDLVEKARSIIEALEAAEADVAALSVITQGIRDYERGRGDVPWKG